MRRKEENDPNLKLKNSNEELENARSSGDLDEARRIRAHIMELQELTGRIRPVKNYKAVLEGQQQQARKQSQAVNIAKADVEMRRYP